MKERLDKIRDALLDPPAAVPSGATISAEEFALIESLVRGDIPSWKMREARNELDRIRAALAERKEGER